MNPRPRRLSGCRSDFTSRASFAMGKSVGVKKKLFCVAKWQRWIRTARVDVDVTKKWTPKEKRCFHIDQPHQNIIEKRFFTESLERYWPESLFFFAAVARKDCYSFVFGCRLFRNGRRRGGHLPAVAVAALAARPPRRRDVDVAARPSRRRRRRRRRRSGVVAVADFAAQPRLQLFHRLGRVGRALFAQSLRRRPAARHRRRFFSFSFFLFGHFPPIFDTVSGNVDSRQVYRWVESLKIWTAIWLIITKFVCRVFIKRCFPSPECNGSIYLTHLIDFPSYFASFL